MRALRELGTVQDWCEDLGALVCICTFIALAWTLIYMTAPKQQDQFHAAIVTERNR